MSERGSFVTEHIYCKSCLEAVRPILITADQHHICAVEVPGRPIIAGTLRGTFQGQEIMDMEMEYGRKISAVICHQLRIAVLAETGSEVFVFHPDKTADPEPDKLIDTVWKR